MRTYISSNTIFKKAGTFVCFAFLLFSVSACTTFDVPTTSSVASTGLPTKHTIQNVPVIPQDDHYCGPAALATVAQYNGYNLSQDKAAEMVYTPGRKGTFQHDVVSAMQRTGLLAVPVNTTETMMEEVAADNPVLIFQNLGLSWKPFWHYSVIAGYDLPERKLLVHGGSKESKWKSFSTIGKTWKRTGFWGYVGVPAGEIPPTASEEDLLQATAALETAGLPDQAAKSYSAIQKAFPNSAGASFGLGNIAMTRENYSVAEKYYRQALSKEQGHVYAANNLAYALSKQGKRTEACTHLKSHMSGSVKASEMLADSYKELCRN